MLKVNLHRRFLTLVFQVKNHNYWLYCCFQVTVCFQPKYIINRMIMETSPSWGNSFGEVQNINTAE